MRILKRYEEQKNTVNIVEGRGLLVVWGQPIAATNQNRYHQFSGREQKKINNWICGNFVFIFLVIFISFVLSFINWIRFQFLRFKFVVFFSYVFKFVGCVSVLLNFVFVEPIVTETETTTPTMVIYIWILVDECEFIHFLHFINLFSSFFVICILVYKSSISWFPLFSFCFCSQCMCVYFCWSNFITSSPFLNVRIFCGIFPFVLVTIEQKSINECLYVLCICLE